jgi:hypothetical protein
MTRASWKRHATVAALCAAPLLITATAGTALAQPKPPPGAPVAGDTQRATALYLKGSELFKAKKYREALDQFKLSYQTVPSPNSHLYVARCLAVLGETRAAWLEFEKVAEEAAVRAVTEPKYAPTRDSANVERDELAPKLSLVTVDVIRGGAGARVHIGPIDVPSDRWSKPFPLEPGTYEVKLDAPGRPQVKVPLTINRGERRTLALDAGGGGVAAGPAPGPAPVASKSNPLRIGGIAAASVGGAGFIMFAVAGAISKATYADLTLQCGGDTGGCHGKNVSDEVSKGKTQQALANAGLIIGAVGAAAGVTMIVLSLRKPAASDSGKPRAELVLKPTWAGIEGSF